MGMRPPLTWLEGVQASFILATRSNACKVFSQALSFFGTQVHIDITSVVAYLGEGGGARISGSWPRWPVKCWVGATFTESYYNPCT